MWKLRYHMAFLALLLSDYAMYYRESQAAPPVPTRDVLVSRLYHQEQLVRSMECTYSVRQTPTDPVMLSLIKQTCNERQQPEKAAQYTVTEDNAAHMSYRARWTRKGRKERKEVFDWLESRPLGAATGSARQVMAFDGQLIRSLSADANGLLGIIDNTQTAHWDNSGRIQPMSMIFEFNGEPYWQLLRDATDVRIAANERIAHDGLDVFFRHPRISDQSFLLRIDAFGRLLERDDYARISSAEEPRLCERHEFSDYRDYLDESGERIGFPHKAIYHYFMGTRPDGTNLEYSSRVIEIDRVAFNRDIDDSEFTLEFPDNIKVIDSVHRLTNQFNPAARDVTRDAEASSWQIAIAVILAVVIGGASFVGIWRNRASSEVG